MTREIGVLLTLVVYNVAMLAIGVTTARRTRDGAEFFLGNRALGPFVTSLSASASSSSAWTLMGVSGAAYAWGLGALWLFPACVGGFVLNWYVLAPSLRRVSRETGALTVTELLAGPPGAPWSRAIRRLASGIVVLSLTVYVATQFQGAGKTFAESFGLSMNWSILLGAAVVVFYTMSGGFWAVSLTDVPQGLVMVAAAIVTPLGALAAVGGPLELTRRLAEVDTPGFLDLTRGLPLGAAVAFVLGLLGIGLGYPGQPHVVNRFMAARDEAAIRIGRIIAIVWAVAIYSGMLLLGLCGRVLFPGLPDPELVLVTATNQLFHPIVAGVVVASVVAAIMSTVDSQVLVAASAVTNDLALGGRSQESLVGRSRLVVLVLSVVAVVLAIWGTKEIFSKVLFAWSAMGSAFGPLLLVRVLSGRVLPRATFLSMAAGFALSVLFYSIPQTRAGAVERIVPFVVALAIAAAGRTGEARRRAD